MAPEITPLTNPGPDQAGRVAGHTENTSLLFSQITAAALLPIAPGLFHVDRPGFIGRLTREPMNPAQKA